QQVLRFNGAVVVIPRRQAAVCSCLSRHSTCFNGAVVVTPRRLARTPTATNASVPLQWGRGCDTTETGPLGLCLLRPAWCFNGAVVVTPRRLFRFSFEFAQTQLNFNGAVVVT